MENEVTIAFLYFYIQTFLHILDIVLQKQQYQFQFEHKSKFNFFSSSLLCDSIAVQLFKYFFMLWKYFSLLKSYEVAQVSKNDKTKTMPQVSLLNLGLRAISSADYIQTVQKYCLFIIILIVMKNIVLIGLVAILLGSSFATDCPINKQKQPKIYSDSVGLTSQLNKSQNNAQNLVYNYQFESPFYATPNVAIGLNQIQASQSPSLDIRVSNAKTSTNGIYFQAESGSESKWKTFKINFLATTRSDMQLGSTTIKSPIINPSDNSFNMIYNIRNDLPAAGLKVKSFLQGINAYSQSQKQIGIKQEGVILSNKQIYFTYSTPQRSSIIRSLTISIIVFNIYTPSVLYADGIIDQNYVVSTTSITIPRHGINQLRTYMVGINSFQTSAAQPISIYSAIDETFSLVIGPIDRNQIDFVSVSYLILSVVDCGSCEGNPLLFDGICQPTCPPGYKIVKGRCVPIGCKEGQILGPRGECVPVCNKNQQFLSGTCICMQGFYRINNICDQCPIGFFYDFKQLNCKPLCGQNSQYRKGRCYCNPGFFLINNRCQTCTYGTKYDSTLQKCLNICGMNQIYSPNGCVCTNGYNRINGKCSRCPYMQIYEPDTQSCVCQNGYDLVFGFCIPNCGPNSIRVNGNCECSRGFYRIKGECKVCGPNADYDPRYERCICKFNFKQINGQCIPNCSDQQYFQNGICKPYCNDGQYYSPRRKCECYPNYQRVDGICRPQCGYYQIRVNGVCKCISGYYKGYSAICQKVNCPSGTAFDQTRGDCISVCSQGKVFINGACVCQYGYNNNNPYGDCVLDCSQDQININGFCQCRAGLVRIANGVCVPISNQNICPQGTVPMFGRCVAPTFCGQNQYWCGNSCYCVNGYYRVNRVCVPVQSTLQCPPYSESNGLNCLCRPGFFPIRPKLCEKCPPGTYWNGRSCQSDDSHSCMQGKVWDPIKGYCCQSVKCNQYQYWDGVRCVCKAGLYFIDDSCRTCPPGTIFDGRRCAQGAGNTVCRDPYSVWNGYNCVCIPGYWALANGRCVTCPEDTYWDGTCCKPRNGQFVPLTIA